MIISSEDHSNQSPLIYFDGGCRPNPGNMDVCIVLLLETGRETKKAISVDQGTNNLAEWTAALWAADAAHTLGLKEFKLLGDSMLVINQLNGSFKVSSKFKPYYDQFMLITSDIKVSVQHVYRDQNLAGIELEY